MARDAQPLVRFGVRVIAEKNGKRQEGSSGGGGRTSIGYFEGKSPEWHAREAARQAVDHARRARGAGRADGGRPGAGRQRHPAARGGRARARGRLQPQGHEQLLGPGRRRRSRATCAPWSTTRRSSRAAAPSTSTTRATSRARALLIEKGKLVGYMHDRLSARHYGLKPSGNGRRESFACAPMPRMTNTILLAGPHDPEEILKSVKRGVYAKKFGGGQVDIANGDFVFLRVNRTASHCGLDRSRRSTAATARSRAITSCTSQPKPSEPAEFRRNFVAHRCRHRQRNAILASTRIATSGTRASRTWPMHDALPQN